MTMPEQKSINAGDPVQENLGSLGRPPWAIVALLGVLVAVVAVGIVWWTFEPQYEAATWLRISSQQPFLAFPPAESDSAAGDLFVQTQVEMVRSPLVLAPVTSQPEAGMVPEFQEEEDPTGWLAEHLEISSVGKSELFKISLACANAKDSARIVNRVAHEYLLLLAMNEAERSQEVISTLREERSTRESEVRRLRENLRKLTMQVTGEDPFSPVPATNPNLDHPLADLSSRLIETEVEETILAANIKALEKQLTDRQAEESAEVRAEDPSGSIEESDLIEKALEQDPEIRQLKEQISLSQAMLDDRESKLTAENAKDDRRCIELRLSISDSEELLDYRRAVVRERIEARLAASPTGQFDSRTAQLEGELASMIFKLEGYRITEELLRERYESKLDEAEAVSGDTLELEFLRDELERAEGVFAVLSERILRLTTEQRAPDQVQLLRPAEKAVAPVEEAPYRAMAVASTAGFCLPFLIVGLCCLLGRSRALEDPVFRRIWFDKPRLWRGEVSFPGEGVVGVAISGRRAGPSDADRKTFLELQRRYQDLKPSIANLLFGQYERYRGEVAETYGRPGVPTLSQPEEIWDHACLEGFRIDKGPNSSIPHLRLAYRFEWDEFRLFFVYLWDWEVVRVEADRG